MIIKEWELLQSGFIKINSLYEYRDKEHTIRIYLYPNGNIESQIYSTYAVTSRPEEEGPAVELFAENGTLILREFRYRGNLKRDPSAGPVIESWYSNGQLRGRGYMSGKSSLYNRDPSEGPAWESYYEDGKLANRTYSFNDMLSRDPILGPAIEIRGQSGEIFSKEYWFEGKRIK